MAECLSPCLVDGSSLISIFDEGYKSFLDLNRATDSSSSDSYQTKVKKLLTQFEDATRLVSSLELFSSNEEVDEISTVNIKFLLLPALLGALTTKLTSEDRRQLLEVAEVYFYDFLSRCKNYNVTDVPECKNTTDALVIMKSNEPSRTKDLADLMKTRENKMRRYKEKKELEEKLADLRKLTESKDVDEEIERDYYLTLIRSWVAQSVEELEDIQKEKPVLEFMEKMKMSDSTGDAKKSVPQIKKPLKPVIITKGDIQKKIYGLGYPSIPVLTIDEFYEQKVKEGTFSVPDMSLQAMALTGQSREAQKDADEIQAEQELESDDIAALMKARSFDDWKDDNRRGDGNRKNMG